MLEHTQGVLGVKVRMHGYGVCVELVKWTLEDGKKSNDRHRSTGLIDGLDPERTDHVGG